MQQLPERHPVPPPPHLERLRLLTDARRADLGLTWEEVAQKAGIRYETIRAFRAGESGGRTATRRDLSTALGWTRGSIDQILAGGDPEPATPAPPPPDAPLAADSAVEEAIADALARKFPGDPDAQQIARVFM